MNPSHRCVLIGGESLLIQCAELLLQRGHTVAAVVSTRPAIRQWAAKRGVRVLRDVAALLAASDVQPIDYLFSVTNLSILSPEVLSLARLGSINFHDGPLPEYAGLNTPVWALLHGATSYGITWHRMAHDVDRGDILVARAFDVDDNETALTLNTKNYGAAVDGFEALLDGLDDGSLTGQPQTLPLKHYFGRKDRPPAAAAIDWTAPVAEAGKLIRALDFGTYANPVASAKVSLGGRAWRVTKALTLQPSARPPGTIVAADAHGITAAGVDGDVLMQGFESLSGQTLTPLQVASEAGMAAGSRADVPSPAQRQRLSDINASVAAHEGFWLRRLETRNDFELPYVDRKTVRTATSMQHLDAQHAPGGSDGGRASVVHGAAVLLTLLARIADKESFDIGYMGSAQTAFAKDGMGWFSPHVPLRVDIDFAMRFDALHKAVDDEIQTLERRGTYALDVVGRTPELKAMALHGDPTRLAIVVQVVETLDDGAMVPGSELTVAFDRSGQSSRWFFDEHVVALRHVQALQRQFNDLRRAAAVDPSRSVASLPLIDDATRALLTTTWNDTASPVRGDVGVHHLIEQQAARTPQRTAITAQGRSITYAELDAKSNQLARRLAALGVKPDVLVGLMCERSIEMMIGLLAIHKAGGAYVPLDPTYPRDRIAYMIDDAKAPVLLTLDRWRAESSIDGTQVIALDTDWPQIATESAAAFDGGALPEHLAYVIYTSGSTGKPKGVMVEHRNVVNFFAGMDLHLGNDAVGTWLAVTSLSFDISVLELCWTLARGFHVVISSDDDRATTGPTRGEHAARPLDFSLFYFSSDESEGVTDKYKLLLEGAKYGDQHGFAAVWTPERHFHAFGGLYPNPAVTGAAIAAITKNVQIRSGSIVLPLHHPLRVAEEWSVVDNISRGRVGVSFASGWQPNDFVLMPQNFADNKGVLARNIELVRSLWRGNAHAFDGPLGKPIEVRVLPRPVQKELPFWITSAGNPETFAVAGRMGANVLTHLLGQTVEELKGKLEIYRAARRDAGHAGEGYVSLMLHAFVGPDEAQVRAKVKQPLIEYLRSSLNLVKQYAWAFPAFKRREGMSNDIDLGSVSPEEMNALLEFSYERYYETSGLFGTPEKCVQMIDAIKAIGVDDVACLIDFGVDSASVLEHLPYLNQLRKLSKPPRVASPEFALPALMAQHAVTHLQCTPSMARMLLLDDAARPGLAKLQRMMVGGEALQPALAEELTSLVGGHVMNMYGPTETTIWSAVHTLERVDGPIPLGRPLANQAIYILDRRQQPLPVGVPGELVIGGLGVVRGYLHRPELTADRFLSHPLLGAQAGRVYRTGDLARLRDDGMVEFLGRLDHQVKVRGYRIELGEIEAALARHAAVSETVVMAREDVPGDVRLVAYLVAKPGTTLTVDELKESLRDGLPDFMLPAHYVVLDALPQTPNGKIDRKQLPAPDQAAKVAQQTEYVAPTGDLEQQIVLVWKDVLKVANVGVRDNFFDLGGHSLLAIQVLRALKETLQRDMSITDIFRFPTVRTLAAHLSDGSASGAAAKQGQDRGQGRRAAMAARRQGTRESTPQP